MMHRLVTMLLLVAVSLHGMLGGFGGPAAFCLGGGHEHAPIEVDVASCELACSHDDAGWPTPVPADGHDDCDCADIELSLIDLLTLSRTAADDLVPAPAPAPLAQLLADAADVEPQASWRGDPWDDPGGNSRVAVVRTTRLRL